MIHAKIAGCQATNSGERVFNIATLLIGLLFGSTLISSLSASMVDYGMTQKDHRDKLKRCFTCYRILTSAWVLVLFCTLCSWSLRTQLLLLADQVALSKSKSCGSELCRQCSHNDTALSEWMSDGLFEITGKVDEKSSTLSTTLPH
eukprot:2688116-Amphidinium_carterae.1